MTISSAVSATGPWAAERRRGPLVSVLLPAWQAEATLGAALRSVRRQTLAEWECVVVDDGSTDGTGAVARACAAADARVRVLHGPHRGLVAALNAGLAACRGQFVARMDADDVMHRERLAAQVAALAAAPGLAAVGCHVRLFPRRGLREGRRAYEAWLNGIRDADAVRAEAFVECPVAHPTLMARAEVLRALGYRDCGWPEDYDLVLRLLARGAGVGVVPRRLLAWRDHPRRLSRTSPAYGLDRFAACKAAFLAAGPLAAGPRYILWGYGATGRLLRRALAARGREPAYIVELHPGRLGKTIHGAPVIAPETLPGLPRLPIVVSVAGAPAREQIRGALAAMGFAELRDFVCAA